MKKLLTLIFVFVGLCFNNVKAEEITASKPWVPLDQQVVTGGTIAATIAMQVPQSQTAAIPLVHFSTSQPCYALNHLKGEFGERMMDSVFTNKLLRSTGGWAMSTPAKIGRTGIDGLYFKMDRNGLPRDLLVSDANVTYPLICA